MANNFVFLLALLDAVAFMALRVLCVVYFFIGLYGRGTPPNDRNKTEQPFATIRALLEAPSYLFSGVCGDLCSPASAQSPSYSRHGGGDGAFCLEKGLVVVTNYF